MKADQYIIAIKRCFILLLALLLTDIFVSIKEYARQSSEQIAEVLGTAFYMLQLAPTFPSLPDSPKYKVAMIYYDEGFKYLKLALEHKLHIIEALNENKLIPPLPAELGDQPLVRAKYLSPIAFQIQQFDCAAVLYSGPVFPTPIFVNIGTDDPTPFDQIVPMSDIFLANLSWKCFPFRFGLSTLIFIKTSETVPVVQPGQATTRETWLVGVPSNIYRHLDAVFPIHVGGPFFSTPINRSVFFVGVPDPYKSLVYMNGEYAVLSSKVLERVILRFAKTVSGKTFREVDAAMNAIADFNPSTIPVIGLPTAWIDIIELSPIVALILLYLIYQRTYILSKVGYTSDVPWLFKDVLRKSDLWLAYASAFVPLLCILIINFLFADVHGFTLSIPYLPAWDIRSLLGIERWVVLDYGNLQAAENIIASIVLMVFLMSLFFGVRVILFLLKISSQNRAVLKGE